jgi:putative sporulation protein YtaF
MVTMFLLTLAVSLDGLTVAMTYGCRGVRLPLRCIWMIACCSGIVMGTAMWVTHSGFFWINEYFAKQIGIMIWIGLGIYTLIQKYIPLTWMQHVAIVRILYTPLTADRDRSGNISLLEAFWLGIALSLDATGVGFGAACVGLPILYTAISATLACGILMRFGLWLGKRIENQSWASRISWLPGVMLIALGISKWWSGS